MAPSISVIICTHNPRADYIALTLDGLRSQTLPNDQWELIIIDNASRDPVARNIDLTWHSRSSILVEPVPGLTHARLRGITAAAGPLMVFVDDDNVLAPDYLARAAALAETWPHLGVFGCGAFTPVWEEAPPSNLAPLLTYLAVHRAPGDRWSNQPGDWGATPAGAGLCVRREVAQRYAELVRNDPRRQWLGRTEAQLAGCEDFDIAFTALDLGFGTGVFVSLAITHHMPASRIRPEYLLRLVEGHAYSMVILMALRATKPVAAPSGIIGRLREFRYRRSLNGIELRIHDARRAGERKAYASLANRKTSAP
jgi:glycosyltransferase involved in cell wall biosynthesis